MSNGKISCDHCGHLTDERAMNCVTHRDWVAHGETMPRWICMSCYSEGDYEDFEEDE